MQSMGRGAGRRMPAELGIGGGLVTEDPLVLRFTAAPGHLLRRAQQVHTDYWSREVHEGVTGPQYATLVAVAGWPEVDQKLAGELASLDKSTIAGVVSRLEKKGWLTRRRDPQDGRRRLLMLTDSAHARLPALTLDAEQVQQLLLAPLSASDRPDFVSLLQRVAFPDSGPIGPAPRRDVPTLEMGTTPGYLIRRAQQNHAASWTDWLGGDLTSTQYAVLTAIATSPDDAVDQAMIGARASLDSSSVTDIVARLAERGWITRDRDPVDRRRMRVSLSNPAMTAMRHLTRSVEQVQKELLRALDKDEKMRFVSLMQRVALIHRKTPESVPAESA